MYDRILAEFYSTPWAILPAKYRTIQAFLHAKAEGRPVPEIAAAAPRKPQIVANAVAVLPVYGVIGKRMNMIMDYSGGTSTDLLLASFRMALADPDVRAIVFDFDTPGGAVPGTPEAWEEIYQTRKIKPLIAQVNALAASCGYYLACGAEEIVSCVSGSTCCIGCYAEHVSIGKALEMQGVEPELFVSSVSPFKAEFNEYELLSEAARAELQRVVDMEGERFVDAVAKGRGVTTKKVKADFGQGRVMDARAALAAGAIDRIGTLEDTLRRVLGRGGKAGSGTRAEDLPIEIYGSVRDDAPPLIAQVEEEEESAVSDPAHLQELQQKELQLRLAELGAR
jgi:signal peptide peptidase SppA